ncbi:MAG: signal peptidase I [Candidatus Omnitrophica bacterium]|nr:signal peptidase I [Candidatus Omnitrophota bacterium]
MHKPSQKLIQATIEGNSMKPWIEEGDVLFIQSIAWDKVKPGNIIVYENKKNSWIAHRVMKKEQNIIFTKADACLRCKATEMIFRDIFIGRVEFVKKKNGKMLNMRMMQSTYYIIKYLLPLWGIIHVLLKYKSPFLILQKITVKIKQTVRFIGKDTKNVIINQN